MRRRRVSGESLGRDGGKQLAMVAGMPVLSWTIKAPRRSRPGSNFVVVVAPSRSGRRVPLGRGRAARPVRACGLCRRRRVAPGVVASGLTAVPESVDVVLVQDGARPLLTPALVSKTLAALQADPQAAGAVVGHPSVDTLKLAEGGVVVHARQVAVLGRANAAGLPQRRAQGRLRLRGSGGLSLVPTTRRSSSAQGGRMVLVEGPRDNIKVTVPEDLVLVEAVLLGAERTEGLMRVGFGYDVHAFATAAGSFSAASRSSTSAGCSATPTPT